MNVKSSLFEGVSLAGYSLNPLIIKSCANSDDEDPFLAEPSPRIFSLL
jgi:hypothetical protein